MSKRTKQVAEDIRGVIASALVVGKVSDPRLRNITITRVSVTADLLQAKVFYTCLDGSQRSQVHEAFQKASSFFRRLIAEELALRFVPELLFYFDEGMEKAMNIHKLLLKVQEESRDSSAGDETEAHKCP